MRIVVDQDEVLADFVGRVLERWNSLNGTAFTKEHVDMWHMENTLGSDRAGRGAALYIEEWISEPGFFETLKPISRAIECFNDLHRAGHDLVVATTISPAGLNAFDGKRAWMKKYFPDWPLKNFITCSRKDLVLGDVLIDDGAHNIQAWLDRGHGSVIVFDAAWNRDLVIPPDRGFRAGSWDEINEYFHRNVPARRQT